MQSSASSELRESVRTFLKRSLRRGAGETDVLSDEQIRNVEIGIFNSAIDHAATMNTRQSWRNATFRVIYVNRARAVLANLIPDSYVGNKALLDRVASGQVQARDVGGLSHDQVCPERWEDLLQTRRQKAEYLATAKPAAMTDQFVCARCKQRECTFTEMQMRACDEPATLFVNCITCGHRWRVG